jgi:hypothetical protein
MEKIMLAPLGAPPATQERISFFQCEIVDAGQARIGVVGTDDMAIALQNLGFAVIDTRKVKGLTFGQAVFVMKQGKKVKRSEWTDKHFIYDGAAFSKFNGDGKGYFISSIECQDIIANDWMILE